MQSTSLLLPNIHCPSCVSSIENLLEQRGVRRESISISIITKVLTFQHNPSDLAAIKQSLVDAGFDIENEDDGRPDSKTSTPPTAVEHNLFRSLFSSKSHREREEHARQVEKERLHRTYCRACRDEEAELAVADALKAVPSKKRRKNAPLLSPTRATATDGAILIDLGTPFATQSVLPEAPEDDSELRTEFSVGGMTCSSCVGTLTTVLSPESDDRIRDAKVTLIPGRAVITHSSAIKEAELKEMIEDAGFEADLVDSKITHAKSRKVTSGDNGSREVEKGEGWTESRFVIEGMTCSSCVGGVTDAIGEKDNPGIRSATVTLLPSVAIVVHDSSLHSTDTIIADIESHGYGATLLSSTPISEGDAEETNERSVKIRVDGMFCEKCEVALNALLSSLRSSSTIISHTPITLAHPYISLTYIPQLDFNLRTLRTSIASLGPFTIVPQYASSSLSLLSAKAARAEANHLLFLIATTFIFAIPTFIIAIVAMTLAKEDSAIRVYFETPVWGNASRGTVALFFLATPIQFGVGWIFYKRSWKSIRGVWRSRSNSTSKWEVWKMRLFRWGSMDSLVALGTTIAWLSSVIFMGLDIRTTAITGGEAAGGGGTMGYFDSSVFLLLFILGGRWLESVSKMRTGDAIEKLGKMKAVEGILCIPGGGGPGSDASAEVDREAVNGETKKKAGEDEEVIADVIDSEQDPGFMKSTSRGISHNSLDITRALLPPTASSSTSATASPPPPRLASPGTEVVSVDFLEKGDILLVPSGASVPLDSILLPSSSSSNFDESSLTGESRPVLKNPKDVVFAGSTNLGPSAIRCRVLKSPGETMIDGIVSAVRDAMGRKASIERLADTITGYFVPVIVGIAGTTLGVWIVLGYSGALPANYLDGQESGGWALFAVQFAVAVLVVACPCGIGLSAPCGQAVGTGLAASLGIVPYGGGESFQNATKIDVIVFDKTGTLTIGKFTVSDEVFFSVPSLSSDTFFSSKGTPNSLFWSTLAWVEEASAHPISQGVRKHCQSRATSSNIPTPTSAAERPQIHVLATEEIAGKGLSATVAVGTNQFEFLVGNEKLLADQGTLHFNNEEQDVRRSKIIEWAQQGKSVVLVALRPLALSSSTKTPPDDSKTDPNPFRIVAVLAVEDPPRPEAAYVIAELQKKGKAVFMCTGDNRVTGLAVARKVGIDEENVFAGVLPIGKRDAIEKLQRGGATDALQRVWDRKGRKWYRFGNRRKLTNRAKVMFVGDGINDIVALTQADVGVAMGGASSVAISSSDFCLLSSNLLSLLTLLSLARATLNKILSNFVWASLFNTALIPIAAGVFYGLNRTRLPPVWAALAMAFSSVSVVTNSLLLRWHFKIPKAVRMFEEEQDRERARA